MTNNHRLAFSPILLTSIGFVGAIVVIAIIAYQLREPDDNLRSVAPAEPTEAMADGGGGNGATLDGSADAVTITTVE
ncbi:MAG: hypothetical protein Aurels2KO_50710 [Aureliella sp.]